MQNYLIIGASSGIGKRLAEQLSESGHHIFGTYCKNEIHSENPLIQLYPLDVLDETLSRDFLPESLSGVVYCPGSINLRPFERIKPNENIQYELYLNEFSGGVKDMLDASVAAITVYEFIGGRGCEVGGKANSMKEEFEVYGLPDWFMKLIGFLKLTLATLLLAGIFVSVLVKPAAIGMTVLMLGAIAMHIKVKDSLVKSFPAFSFLVLSLGLIFF